MISIDDFLFYVEDALDGPVAASCTHERSSA
jgi:hypothetical protein